MRQRRDGGNQRRNNKQCRERPRGCRAACDQLVETVSGWLYVPTGNLFKREQVQPSQDRQCHVCLGRGREHRSICAFIVPNV